MKHSLFFATGSRLRRPEKQVALRVGQTRRASQIGRSERSILWWLASVKWRASLCRSPEATLPSIGHHRPYTLSPAPGGRRLGRLVVGRVGRRRTPRQGQLLMPSS